MLPSHRPPAEAVVTGAEAPRAPVAEAPRPPVGLYLHVPFCVYLCPYCDFVVYTGNATRGPGARVEAIVRAVHVELDLRADALEAGFGSPGSAGRPALDSVYLGGGTPSLLAATDVAAVLKRIERRYGLATGAEVTIEVNPGPDERGYLAGLRAAGVTRVSVGAQSFDAAELRRIGRRHRPVDIAETVEAARRAGITHRSVDLLYDLPGQSMATWQATLARALDLPIDHVSAYALTLDDPDAAGLTGSSGDHLPVRAGAARWRRDATKQQDDDRAVDQYLWLDEVLQRAGFTWYEISNWARPDGESRHNQAYWRRQATVGVGPGAHGFDGGRRRTWNAARLDGYLAALLPAEADRGGADRAQLPPGGLDMLDDDAIQLEAVSLALRTREGLARDEVSGAGRAELKAARRAGLVEPNGPDRIRLTARGRLLAGSLAVALAP